MGAPRSQNACASAPNRQNRPPLAACAVRLNINPTKLIAHAGRLTLGIVLLLHTLSENTYRFGRVHRSCGALAAASLCSRVCVRACDLCCTKVVSTHITQIMCVSCDVRYAAQMFRMASNCTQHTHAHTYNIYCVCIYCQ